MKRQQHRVPLRKWRKMEAAAIPKQSPKKGARNDYFELSKLGNFLSFSKEPVASRRRKNEDEDAIVDKEKLKSKVVNVWNNVKYGTSMTFLFCL